MLREMYEKYPRGVESLEDNYGDSKTESIVSVEELEEQCGSDIELKELLSEMLEACYRYTETVFKYNEILNKTDLKDDDFRKEMSHMENNRTIIHNAMMDSINIFSRQLGEKEKDNNWAKKLQGHRAHYAKFAMMTTYKEMEKEMDKEEAEEVAT
jgi:hypothetical protein